MNNNRNQIPQQGQQQKLPSLNDLINPIPLITRVFYFLWIAMWVASLFLSSAFQNFPNSFTYTVRYYQFWRLFTSILYESSFFILSIVIFNSYSFLPNLERKHGSAFLVVSIFYLNFIIQILTLAFEMAILLIFGTISFLSSNAIVGIWVNLMFKFCFYNPAQIKLCCFGWKLSRIVYPFVLLLLISFFAFQIRSEMIAGIILAVFECYILKGNGILILPNAIYNFFERFFDKIKLSQMDCYFRLNLQNNDGFFSNLDGQADNASRKGSRATSIGSDVFRGKQGYKLSGQDS